MSSSHVTLYSGLDDRENLEELKSEEQDYSIVCLFTDPPLSLSVIVAVCIILLLCVYICSRNGEKEVK